MKTKKKALTVITVAFFTLLVVSTFLSKTIYYYTHEKVTAVAVSNGFINNEFKNINVGLVIDGGDNIVFPVKLKEPLVVKKIMVGKTSYVSENDTILLFDPDSVKIARNYILADIKDCERKEPVNIGELTALEEQLKVFDTYIDENGNLLSSKSGFIKDIYLKEGDPFYGADQMYTISNDETNYRISLHLSREQGSYIDDNCEITVQKDEILIKGFVQEIIFKETDCSVIVQPTTTLVGEDAMELFSENKELPMDIKTSSGRYDTIVPAEAIMDQQFIYNLITVENFLGSQTIAEKTTIQILATDGEMTAIDTKNRKLMPGSKVITSKPNLVGGEEVVINLD